MPSGYLILHLLLAAAAAAAALKLRPRSAAAWLFGGALSLLIVTGLVLERRPELAWQSLRLSWPDLVFFSNLTLEGVVALLVALWRSTAKDRRSLSRAAVLGTGLLAASLWSYAWYFAPVPGVWGTVDATGYCRQTTDDSCSAAAAAMVLTGHGVPATEREMAVACLTRTGHGTPTLGLFRGLALKGGAHGLHPRLVTLAGPAGLARASLPAILRIGLRAGAPAEIAEEMEEYGWTPGQHHSVVVLAADPSGRWLDIADPSYGRERWPAAKLEWIWDSRALVLE